MGKLTAYLRLVRPANIVTSMADIFAGYAISGLGRELLNDNNHINFLYLLISTACLYGGGIVLNDVFDADLDAKERPERPIPKGEVKVSQAVRLSLGLYTIGILAAYQVNIISGLIAIVISFLSVIYDKISKHHPFWGPANMGACRSFNLMLGMSAIPVTITDFWYFLIIPFIFISAITTLSRGEVSGLKGQSGQKVLVLFVILLAYLIFTLSLPPVIFISSMPFLVLFLLFFTFPFSRSLKSGKPVDVRKAVKAGVLSLILLDATIAAGFAGIIFGFLVVLLLPLSMVLARTFAVT